MRKTSINDNGFTLVESMLSVVFFSIALTTVFVGLVAIIGRYRSITSQDQVQRQSVQLEQVLQRRAQESSTINTSQGKNFDWRVSDTAGSGLDAICFDNHAILFIRDIEHARYESPMKGLIVYPIVYSAVELPISDTAGCNPYNWNTRDSLPEGLVDNRNTSSNNLSGESVFSNDAQILSINIEVDQEGRSARVAFQIGTQIGLVSVGENRNPGSSQIREVDDIISRDMKYENNRFICRPGGNDLDLCWIESKSFAVVTSSGGG